MRIFLAGATGAIGKRLTPTLVSAGHQVTGMTRSPDKVAVLRAMGAEAAVADAVNREAVREAVLQARPDVVVHQLTSLARMRNLKHWDAEFAVTNRLRVEGTEYLLAAALEAGAKRFVAQSYAGWPSVRNRPGLSTEGDPFEPNPPRSMQQSLDAIRKLEAMTTSAEGIAGVALRYGGFYGPGTSLGAEGDMTEMVRHRRFPIFGSGDGVWSFLHIDDAAIATWLAVEHAPAGVYQIVDDDPAPVSDWLPDLARAIGAPPPLHLPGWLGRLLIGEAGMLLTTQTRGSSNAKARRVLGWRPIYPSWRDGFRHGMAADPLEQPLRFQAHLRKPVA